MSTLAPQLDYKTPIFIAQNCLDSDSLVNVCHDKSAQTIIITDSNVGPIYATALKQRLGATNVIEIPAGEQSKSQKMVDHIIEQLLHNQCGRDTTLVALGGGVVTDLVGFVAAIYLRGVPVVYCPTSLLAMVDAAIGGKTGINNAFGKNLVGTISQPKAIFTDISTLETLPTEEYYSAYAEIIKHAVIYDPVLFKLLQTQHASLINKSFDALENIIKQSSAIKVDVVVQDEREHGIRAILNFGHTISHALEIATDYQLSHGNAVALGMMAESFLANQLGILSDQDMQTIVDLIQQYPFPFRLPKNISIDTVRPALTMDKKSRKNQLRFVLPIKIGQMHIVDGQYTHVVAEQYIDTALDFLLNQVRE